MATTPVETKKASMDQALSGLQLNQWPDHPPSP